MAASALSGQSALLTAARSRQTSSLQCSCSGRDGSALDSHIHPAGFARACRQRLVREAAVLDGAILSAARREHVRRHQHQRRCHILYSTAVDSVNSTLSTPSLQQPGVHLDQVHDHSGSPHAVCSLHNCAPGTSKRACMTQHSSLNLCLQRAAIGGLQIWRLLRGQCRAHARGRRHRVQLPGPGACRCAVRHGQGKATLIHTPSPRGMVWDRQRSAGRPASLVHTPYAQSTEYLEMVHRSSSHVCRRRTCCCKRARRRCVQIQITSRGCGRSCEYRTESGAKRKL